MIEEDGICANIITNVAYNEVQQLLKETGGHYDLMYVILFFQGLTLFTNSKLTGTRFWKHCPDNVCIVKGKLLRYFQNAK